MIIRKVLPTDLNAVTEVETQCFPPAEAATKASFEQRINTYPESFFVVEVDKKIVGFINGCITNEKAIYDELFSDISLHNPTGDYQAIFGLVVLLKYRKQGIAAKLMNHMINESKLNGRKGVILTCKDALIPYYEKFGFVNKGISKSEHGGVVWFDMLLKLE